MANFDFNRPKVRKDGKVLDKFSLCQEIHELAMSKSGNYYDCLTFSIYPEIYSYAECVSKLKSLLF